jgi:hypothetical protein
MVTIRIAIHVVRLILHDFFIPRLLLEKLSLETFMVDSKTKLSALCVCSHWRRFYTFGQVQIFSKDKSSSISFQGGDTEVTCELLGLIGLWLDEVVRVSLPGRHWPLSVSTHLDHSEESLLAYPQLKLQDMKQSSTGISI